MAKDLSRKQLQQSLQQGVDMALATVPVFRADDVDHLRRLCRALVHIAATPLLDKGCPPSIVLAYCAEAIAHEVEARTKAEAEAQIPEAESPLFILPEASA